MQTSAKSIEPLQPGLAYGQVLAEDDGLFYVGTDGGTVRALAAAGCLLRPQPGDRVLITTDGDGESYILSVLKRAQGPAVRNRLVFDGQVDLEVNGGGLNLAADTDLSLAAGRKMALTSDKIAVHADQGEAAIGKLSLVSKVLQANVKRIRTVARTVDQTCRRLTQRLQDAYRFVADHDEAQAGSARYLVEDTLTVNTKNTVHMAEEVVTINAEQVHLG